jgi:hypothetical protein
MIRRIIGVLAMLVFGPAAVWAAEGHAHAVAAKAGLLGLGLEYNYYWCFVSERAPATGAC